VIAVLLWRTRIQGWDDGYPPGVVLQLGPITTAFVKYHTSPEQYVFLVTTPDSYPIEAMRLWPRPLWYLHRPYYRKVSTYPIPN